MNRCAVCGKRATAMVQDLVAGYPFTIDADRFVWPTVRSDGGVKHFCKVHYRPAKRRYALRARKL